MPFRLISVIKLVNYLRSVRAAIGSLKEEEKKIDIVIVKLKLMGKNSRT